MNPVSSPLQGALFLARRFIAGRERPLSRHPLTIPKDKTKPVFVAGLALIYVAFSAFKAGLD
jgi:hypothetical protein